MKTTASTVVSDLTRVWSCHDSALRLPCWFGPFEIDRGNAMRTNAPAGAPA